MGDVNLKRKTGLQWQKPIFLENKKRSSQSLSLERDSDSDVVHANIRVRKHEGQRSTRKVQDYPNEAQTTIKEWNVLYTTQLTQKAKKYHDGILRLVSGSLTNQVMLLNEDGTELSRKYLKSIDRIETGHDCELPNYLIQICESRTLPVGNNCLSGCSSEQVTGYRNLMGKSTNNSRANIKSINNDIQNRHFGQVNSGSSDEARSMDINLKSAQEWTALYTTQKTQKAKKYHDGIFRLVNQGSHMKQIFLLTEEGEVLNSRYLKSTESVETGCSYEFPNYLVEVCETKAPIRDNNPGGSAEKNAPCTASEVGKSMDSKSVLNAYVKNDHLEQVVEVSDNTECNDNNTKSTNEWTALYTSQKTQKAKKYHDGILRLVNCGSHMKQIVLLNEEGDILNSRYLKSTEMVETGCSYEFPNYLVEVCESKAPAGEQALHKVSDKAEASNKNIKSTHDIKKEDSGKTANNFSNDNITLHNLTEKPMLEWNVMYATQTTLKAKKYQNGILQISHHGSQMKLAILLNEDGAVLSSKYFKSAGRIKIGHKFEFPNYLVKICEPCAPGRETEGGLPMKQIEQVADCTISNTEVLSTPISRCKMSFQGQFVGKCHMISFNLLYDSNALTTQYATLTFSHVQMTKKAQRSQIATWKGLLLLTIDTFVMPVRFCPFLESQFNFSLQILLYWMLIIHTRYQILLLGNQKKIFLKEILLGYKILKICILILNMIPLHQISCLGNYPFNPHQSNKIWIMITKNEYLRRSPAASEVSYDHIHSSPNHVQKNLLEDSLPSSSSPPEKDIGVDKIRSLSDEIMNLQQEWTTLSHRASTIGNTHNNNSSLQDDIPVDENYVAALPSCNKSESMHTELVSISNVNDFPSFDLGFS